MPPTDQGISNHETSISVDDAILHSAQYSGLPAENIAHGNDFVIQIGEGKDKLKYVYNYVKKTLIRQDSSGKKYYSDNGEETKTEKLFFLYELKKLFLQNKQEENSKNLENGTFCFETLLLDDNSISQSSQLKELEEKIRHVDDVIDILKEEDCNYGASFGKQAFHFIKVLANLREKSNDIDEVYWENEIIEYIDKSLIENIESVCPDGDNTKYTNTDKYAFIKECIKIANCKQFKPDQLKELKTQEKYLLLENTSNENYFGGLIRNLKYKSLLVRKIKIERQLQQTDLIESKIRNKKKEIKSLENNFSQENVISEDDKKKFERLLKAQHSKTDRNYKTGLNRVGEVSENDKLIRAIRHFQFNTVSEMSDLKNMFEIKNQQYARILNAETNQAEMKQHADTLREYYVPTLEQKCDSLEIVTANLKNEIKNMELILKTLKDEEKKRENELKDLESEKIVNEQAISKAYQKLAGVLRRISQLNNKIEELRTQKKSVGKIERSKFNDRIFEKAGGQKKGDSAIGFVNHKSCPDDVPLSSSDNHCRYRLATEEAVDFALKETNKNIHELNKTTFYDYLSGFEHSANRGNGRHAEDLEKAAGLVFLHYKELQNTIMEKEEECQRQIEQNEDNKSTKESERDDLRRDIITKENELNRVHLNMLGNQKEIEDIVQKIKATERHIDLMEKYKDSIVEIVLSSTKDDLIKKNEDLNDILNEIADQKTTIGGMIAEIVKPGEIQEKFAVCETRWRYSQVERVLKNIGLLDQQKLGYATLKEEIDAIKKRIGINYNKRQELTTNVTNNEEKKNTIILSLQGLFRKQHAYIDELWLYGNKISSTVQINHTNIQILEKNQQCQLSFLKNHKQKIIERAVYENVLNTQKGTTFQGDDFSNTNFLDTIGNIGQLYGIRKHKDCQNIFERNRSQACKYFSAIHDIIKKLLETDNKPNNKIFEELKSENENYEMHVLQTHQSDIEKSINIIKNEINRFEKYYTELVTTQKKDQEKLNQQLSTLQDILTRVNKLSGCIVLERFYNSPDKIEDYFDAGVDCLVLSDSSQIVIRKNSQTHTFTIENFVAEIFPFCDTLPEDIVKSEVQKIFDSRRAVPIEGIFSRREGTYQKKISCILIEFFDKTYLKNTIAIINQLKELFEREKETLKINEEIEEIDRENNFLQKKQFFLEKTLTQAEREIKRLTSEINIDGGDDIQNFKVLKNVCAELLDKEKLQNEKDIETIKADKNQLKTLMLESKNVQLTELDFKILKKNILENRLKMELHSNCNDHRACCNPNNTSCGYFQTLEPLLNKTISQIQEGHIVLRAPEYKVSSAIQSSIIEGLNLQKNHLNLHLNALKRIISYIAQKYGVEIQNKISLHYQEINELELKITNTEAVKEARLSDSGIIANLTNLVEKIDNLLIFRKDVLFLDRNIVAEDASLIELRDYNKEEFQITFRKQIKCLLTCFDILNSRVKVLSVENIISAVNDCIYNTFCEYFPGIRKDQSMGQVILKLKDEIQQDYDDSKIKMLGKKKRGKMAEYLLKEVSYRLNENYESYDERFDPEKIYYQILECERKKKEQKEGADLEKLQQELSDLKAERKELFMQNDSTLRNELENIDICLRFIENAMDISSLKFKMEEINETKSNRDDYYCFVFQNNRVCVRLLNTDPALKSAEIKEIDRVRNCILAQTSELLRFNVLSESYLRELKEQASKDFQIGYIKTQRKILLNGFMLCKYERFVGSDEILDETDSFISSTIGVLIGENNLFLNNGWNEMSPRIEGWTRKIRLKYNANNHSRNMTLKENLVKIPELKLIQLLITLINDEFNTDKKLSIRQINILNTGTKIDFLQDSGDKGIVITVLMQEAKCFFVLPKDKVELHTENKQIDTSMKMSYMFGVLNCETELFHRLFHEQFFESNRSTIENCPTLAETYKDENAKLTKISTLREFNVIICSSLKNYDAQNESICLSAYLIYFEQLENSLQSDEPYERAQRFKNIKALYHKAMTSSFKAEQLRRRAKTHDQFKQSKEELYLKDLINEGEGEMTEILIQIDDCEKIIEKESNLKDTLLLEKETVQEKYRTKIETLSNITADLKDKIKSAQEKLIELNKEQRENQEEIANAQEELENLQGELINVENEMTIAQNKQQTLVSEIDVLEKESRKMAFDLNRVKAEKKRKEMEAEENKKEKEASEFVMLLIKNLISILSNSALYSKTNEVKDALYNSHNFPTMLKNLKTTLQDISADDTTNFWQKLVQGKDYEQFEEFVCSGKKIAGESQSDIFHRIRDVVSASLNFECEIVSEIFKGKEIKRFKVLAGNVHSHDLHNKIKNAVENKMQAVDSCGGLYFQNNKLCASEYGVTSIPDLPKELRPLVEKKIELHFTNDIVEEQKTAKSPKASQIINDLQIDYLDIVNCFIDEIEIIASQTFSLDESYFYPGVDLTITTVNMECVGANLEINSSGRDGGEFRNFKAPNGITKRIPPGEVAKGDKGCDGYDGAHGGHAGNITIKVENEIINLEALTTIKANGGHGGKGQLGGDGDDGTKGFDGKNGVAPETLGLQGGQTTIGFGSPGTPGGRGGPCGLSGRPGVGGKAGQIEIEHCLRKINLGERTPGHDAVNILDECKPKGGLGGEPGLYGMDQVQYKKDIFTKTVIKYTTIDRAAFVRTYPQYTKIVLASGNISYNVIQEYGKLVVEAAVDTMVMPDIIVKNEEDETDESKLKWLDRAIEKCYSFAHASHQKAIKFIAKAAFLVNTPILTPIAFIGGMFADCKLSYEEVKNSTEYRDRDKDCDEKRGQKNEDEACLRSDNSRVPQKEKREAINIDSLQSKLSDKKNSDREISGEALHEQHIYNVEIERDEIQWETETCAQEERNLQCAMENNALAKEAKVLELEKVKESIVGLRNKRAVMENSRKTKIDQIVRETAKAQKMRDRMGTLDLDVEQTLAKLEHYKNLGEEFFENYHEHIQLIDKYLNALQASLRRNRQTLKYLKNKYAKKVADVHLLNKNLESLQQERSQLFESEVEIEEEIEQEAEIVHLQEITQLVDVENALDLETEKDGKWFRKVKANRNILKNIKSLNSVERHLLLNELQKIKGCLERDPLSNLKMEENLQIFVLRMMEKIELQPEVTDKKQEITKQTESEYKVSQKLRKRFTGENLLVDDKIHENVSHFLDLFDDMKIFDVDIDMISPFNENRTLLIAFNEQRTFNDLVCIVETIVNQNKLLEEKTRDEHVIEYVQDFFSVVIENIRHHGLLILSLITQRENESHRHSTEIEILNLLSKTKQFRTIVGNLQSINANQKYVITQLIDMIFAFSNGVEKLKQMTQSIKDRNKTMKLLKMLTKKLINYVDISCEEIHSIAKDYIDLLTNKSFVDTNRLEDIANDIEDISTSFVEANV